MIQLISNLYHFIHSVDVKVWLWLAVLWIVILTWPFSWNRRILQKGGWMALCVFTLGWLAVGFFGFGAVAYSVINVGGFILAIVAFCTVVSLLPLKVRESIRQTLDQTFTPEHPGRGLTLAVGIGIFLTLLCFTQMPRWLVFFGWINPMLGVPSAIFITSLAATAFTPTAVLCWYWKRLADRNKGEI